MRRDDLGLGVRYTNLYGLSEIIGPGVSGECAEERSGSHVNEDHSCPRSSTPSRANRWPTVRRGAVFTTLTKQALPLIRY